MDINSVTHKDKTTLQNLRTGMEDWLKWRVSDMIKSMESRLHASFDDKFSRPQWILDEIPQQLPSESAQSEIFDCVGAFLPTALTAPKVSRRSELTTGVRLS